MLVSAPASLSECGGPMRWVRRPPSGLAAAATRYPNEMTPASAGMLIARSDRMPDPMVPNRNGGLAVVTIEKVAARTSSRGWRRRWPFNEGLIVPVRSSRRVVGGEFGVDADGAELLEPARVAEGLGSAG